MTNEEAKKMLKAKLECLKNETSGINYGCNMRLCDGCSLNYEQGNMGEQKEALEMAIRALEQTDALDKIRAEIASYGAIWIEYIIPGHTDRDIEKIVENVLREAKEQVLSIIDKYKVESEDKE